MQNCEKKRDAAQAREATLTKELAARDAALAQRTNEYGERIQQAATGDMLHLKATTGSSASYPPLFPMPVGASITFGRAIIARDTVQTPDLHADPDHYRRTINSDVPVRGIVAMPLLRNGTPIGAIVLGRNVPGEFSVAQVELLRTFAEQTIIARRDVFSRSES